MTWLVADLTSKSEIQWRLLQKMGVLEEDAVLRASEFWAKIFRILYPDWTLVSHDFMRSHLSDFLSDHNQSFAQSPGAHATLMAFLQQLLPVVSHEGLDAREWSDWFQGNTAQFVRWGHWYEISHEAWQELKQSRIMTASWCSAMIVNHPEVEGVWSRTLVCDLGSQLNAIESEIIKRLSANQEVRVLRPAAPWVESYSKSLNSYYHLEGLGFPEKTNLKSRPIPKSQPNCRVEVERYSTMVAEVKSIVAKVRDHLDRGIEPQQIGIFAPDIEVYWPTLRSYLEQEGVPVQKNWVARLQSFSDVECWLARMRLSCGRVTSHDLERVQFYKNENFHELSFDRFKRLFSVIYDEIDLKRLAAMEKKYQKSVAEDDRFLFDEFLAWSSSYWPNGQNSEPLSRMLKKLFQECPLQTTRSVRGWLDYLESLVAKEEVLIEGQNASGIYCLNLQDGEWVHVEVRFFIGLSAQALRSQDSVGLLYQDVEKIGRDLGYFLPWPDRAQMEFDCLWLLQTPAKWTQLSVSSTDFSGSPEAPSLVWLLSAFSNNREVERLSEAFPTRWDEIQQSELSQIGNLRQWPENFARTLETSILRDLGEHPFDAFGEDVTFSLSASQVESYLDCPFKFAASKLLRLTDEAVVDLDIDAMSSGRLLHKLFELLTAPPFRSNWSDQELNLLLDRLPVEADVPLADKRLWRMRNQFYLDLSRRFLAFEKNLRDQFPELETVGREVRFDTLWSPSSGCLVTTADDGIPFRGSIDRVDRDQSGHYAVVDYKTSDNGLTYHRSWVNNSELQLALYGMAVESGLTSLPAGEVIAAFYHFAKGMRREKGMRVADLAGTLFSLESGKTGNITVEEKQELFALVNQKINSAVLSMLSGRFEPKPSKDETCNKCSWKKLCRAPHLNR